MGVGSASTATPRPHWQRGGRGTPQWVTLGNLVDLLARVDAHEPAAVLYRAFTASSTAP